MYGSKMRKIRNIDPELQTIIENINFQALHAQSLGFIHPTSGKELFFYHRIASSFVKLKKMLKSLEINTLFFTF